MSVIITILLTILIFGILIFVHELGHFVTAKLSGIKVNEFALGMGPTLFKIQKGETKYAIRAFPIGGFVSMEGEDQDSDDNRAFNNKPKRNRFLVLFAGAAMNLLLGIILTFCIVITSDKIATTKIAQFNENAMTEQTGLRVDDEILKINGSSVLSTNDIIYAIVMDDDGVVEMVVKRDGEKVTLSNVTFEMEEVDGEQSPIFDFKVKGAQKTVGTVVKGTFTEFGSKAKLIWSSLVDLVSGNVSMSELSGPVGIATVVDQARTSEAWLSSIINLTAFLTINLGIFNLLPFPALDGGRIVFLAIEAIRGKPVDKKYEGFVNFAGFALLMLLTVFITIKDVVNLF